MDTLYHSEGPLSEYLLPIYLVVSRFSPPVMQNGFHYHPQLEFGICISGSGVFCIRNNVYPFSAGDISVIFPGEHHIAKSSPATSSEWWFITINVPFLLDVWPAEEGLSDVAEQGCGHILTAEEKKTIEHYLHRLISLCPEEWKTSLGEKNRVASLVIGMLYEMADWQMQPASPGKEFTAHIQILEPAIRYMLDHYAEPVTTEALAACCHISSQHLRRLFQNAMGTSPLTFLHRIRITHACSALASTDTSILEIAEKCGYSSLSSFNRQFRQILYMTPSEYRHKIMKET